MEFKIPDLVLAWILLVEGKKAITKDSESASYSIFDDKELFNCLMHLPCLTNLKRRKFKKRKWHNQFYLNLPENILEDNPLDIENIKEKQVEDNKLQQLVTRHPEWYISCKTFNNIAWTCPFWWRIDIQDIFSTCLELLVEDIISF